MQPHVFNFKGEHFSAHADEQVAVLKLTGNVYEIAQDFAVKESFFKLLSVFESDANLHCLLVVSDHDVLGEAAHEKFWARTLELRAGTEAEPVARRDRAEMRAAREENALLQACRAFAASRKIIIVAADGSIVSPFFGAMLACDFRVVTNRSTVVFPHIKLRMAPIGAIAYYLPRYLGPSLARSCLLFGSPLPAMRARELGLFDAVVTVDEYAEACVAFARQAATIPSSVVKYTKDLLRLEWDHFEEFADWESSHLRIDDEASA